MKKFWNDRLDNLIRRNYPKGDLQQLAGRLGVTVTALKARANVIGVHRKVNAKRQWTDRQLAYLRKHYPTMTAQEIADKMHRPVSSIWNKAASLGLKKTPEFLAELGRQNSNHPNMVAQRFKKGHTPYNKGMQEWQFRSKDACERCQHTQFRPGHSPHNTRPVGYERIDKRDGYVYVKVEGFRKMVMKHRYVWNQHYGEIPDGHIVMFRDGDRTNCDIDNLELVSRKDAARRQIGKETPEQRRRRVAKCVESRNKSIRRDKVRLHFGLEPLGKLVKRW